MDMEVHVMNCPLSVHESVYLIYLIPVCGKPDQIFEGTENDFKQNFNSLKVAFGKLFLYINANKEQVCVTTFK